jgi:CheY-like chemotaxis protein
MPTVLIVDDHHDTCATLRALFRRAGWIATAVTEPRSAVDVLHTVRADVVLLDVMMPGLDGFDLLDLIRADPVAGRTPVVMYSALHDPATVARAAALGAADYVRKGTAFDVVRDRVARAAAAN